MLVFARVSDTFVTQDDQEHVRTLLTSPAMFAAVCKENFRKLEAQRFRKLTQLSVCKTKGFRCDFASYNCVLCYCLHRFLCRRRPLPHWFFIDEVRHQRRWRSKLGRGAAIGEHALQPLRPATVLPASLVELCARPREGNLRSFFEATDRNKAWT